MAKQTKSEEGFTIIEVVLVLAIAGLIFLMVFVALPALQRSQKDTQRRNDMAQVNTALTNFQNTNQGTNSSSNLPKPGTYVQPEDSTTTNCSENWSVDSACLFIQNYMNSGTSKENTFEDPDGSYYNLVITENMVLSKGLLETTSIPGNSNSKLIESDGGYTIGGDSPFKEHVIYIIPGSKCEGQVAKKAEKRNYSVLYRLDGSSVWCIDDQ